MTGNARRALVHPLALVVMTLPAMLEVLIAEGFVFGLSVIATAVLVLLPRRPRLAGITALTAAVMIPFVWFGFVLWMPAEPNGVATPVIAWLPFAPTTDQALAALAGSVRVFATAAPLVAVVPFVRWRVLADSAIASLRVPYRIVDVLGLGDRFVRLLHDDLRTADLVAGSRVRGRPLRKLALGWRRVVPVLHASLRHGDALATAMESRGFGAGPARTVHEAEPLLVRDATAVLVVTALVFAAARLLG